MKKINPGINRLIALFFCFSCIIIASAQEKKADNNWKQYANAEAAGFSSKALALVKTQLGRMNTASFLVVYKGNILLSYGDNTRKFMLHSIRKGIMNAMIGIEIKNGSLNIDQSLKELNIDDIGKLTEEEMKATIKDLLSARSGVYHPSAYAPRGMVKSLPGRGSHKASTYWYYNNWDFNTLLTIYEQQSGKKFFEAFKNEIADPIGMEDFSMDDTFYRLEEDKSMHPAYLFRMSARDMARFGLLYARNGDWNNDQLVPSDWIKKSTQAVSTDLGNFSSRNAYGLLWWVSAINNKKMYYASGSGGHSIMIFPEDDMVMVHRVNTYENFNVSEKEIHEIASQILNAKQKSVNGLSSPGLIPYKPSKKNLTNSYKGSMDRYIGVYRHRFLGNMTIKRAANGYILLNGIGKFNLYATSENTFFPEDIEIPIVMIKATEESKKFTVESVMDHKKALKEVVFYY